MLSGEPRRSLMVLAIPNPARKRNRSKRLWRQCQCNHVRNRNRHHFIFRPFAQQHHHEKMDEPAFRYRSVPPIQNAIQAILQSRIRRYHGRNRNKNRLRYKNRANSIPEGFLESIPTILLAASILQLRRPELDEFCH